MLNRAAVQRDRLEFPRRCVSWYWHPESDPTAVGREERHVAAIGARYRRRRIGTVQSQPEQLSIRIHRPSTTAGTKAREDDNAAVGRKSYDALR
jgi:hypothetical protein